MRLFHWRVDKAIARMSKNIAAQIWPERPEIPLRQLCDKTLTSGARDGASVLAQYGHGLPANSNTATFIPEGRFGLYPD